MTAGRAEGRLARAGRLRAEPRAAHVVAVPRGNAAAMGGCGPGLGVWLPHLPVPGSPRLPRSGGAQPQRSLILPKCLPLRLQPGDRKGTLFLSRAWQSHLHH